MKWSRRTYILRTLQSAAFAAGGALIGACAGLGAGSPESQPALRRGIQLLIVLGTDNSGGNVAWYERSVTEWAEPLGLSVHVVRDNATREKVIAMTAGGTPPDAFHVRGLLPGDLDVRDLAFRKLVRNLDPFVRRDRYDFSDFVKDLVESLRFRGSLYGMPGGYGVGQNVHCMYYNKTAFRDAGITPPSADWNARGWDWPEVLTAAQRLTQTDGAGSVTRYGALVLRAAWSGVWPWVHGNGGRTLNRDSSECVLTQPAVVETLQFLQDTVVRYRVGVPRGIPGTSNVHEAFEQGRVAILGSGVGIAAARRYRSSIPASSFEWDVAPYPRGKGGRFTLWHSSGIGIAGESRNPEETWGLVKFLMTKESIPPDNYYLSARRSVQDASAEFSDPSMLPKGTKTVIRTLSGHGGAEPETVVDKWPEIVGLLDKKLQSLWDGTQVPSTWTAELKPQIDGLLRLATKLT